MGTPDLQLIQDRLDVADTIYAYASNIDSFNLAGVRELLADDLVAQYGNAEPVHGGQAVADWIGSATTGLVWQHHLLSVYHTDIDGDTAKALVYHTSHQLFTDDLENVKVIVARYHNELRRGGPRGWKISKLLMEICWAEHRPDNGYLEAIGGHGPHDWHHEHT